MSSRSMLCTLGVLDGSAQMPTAAAPQQQFAKIGGKEKTASTCGLGGEELPAGLVRRTLGARLAGGDRGPPRGVRPPLLLQYAPALCLCSRTVRLPCGLLPPPCTRKRCPLLRLLCAAVGLQGPRMVPATLEACGAQPPLSPEPGMPTDWLLQAKQAALQAQKSTCARRHAPASPPKCAARTPQPFRTGRRASRRPQNCRQTGRGRQPLARHRCRWATAGGYGAGVQGAGKSRAGNKHAEQPVAGGCCQPQHGTAQGQGGLGLLTRPTPPPPPLQTAPPPAAAAFQR
jgi:hypothetical protein